MMVELLDDAEGAPLDATALRWLLDQHVDAMAIATPYGVSTAPGALRRQWSNIMISVSTPPMIDMTISMKKRVWPGSHSASAPIILTSPPPIQPKWKAPTNSANTPIAIPTCHATSIQP